MLLWLFIKFKNNMYSPSLCQSSLWWFYKWLLFSYTSVVLGIWDQRAVECPPSLTNQRGVLAWNLPRCSSYWRYVNRIVCRCIECTFLLAWSHFCKNSGKTENSVLKTWLYIIQTDSKWRVIQIMISSAFDIQWYLVIDIQTMISNGNDIQCIQKLGSNQHTHISEYIPWSSLFC